MNTKYKVINKERSFTITQLTEKINKRFKKKSGLKYNCSDTKRYVMRGHLPAHMGGFALRDAEVGDTGIKYIEVLDRVPVRGKKVIKVNLFDN